MQRPLQRRWPSVPGESWLRRLRIALPPLVVMSAAIRCRVTSVRACEFTGCLPAGRARAPAAPTACWTASPALMPALAASALHASSGCAALCCHARPA